MYKGPSQVSSGNIVPTVVGPQKEMKEIAMLAGLVLFLAGLIAAAWYYGQLTDRVIGSPAAEPVESGAVSEVLRKASVLNEAEASVRNLPLVSNSPGPGTDTIHTDVYFELGRKGLTEEGKAQVAAHAELLKQQADYGMLIQGYTDQQGSAGYNVKLGLKRAEAVKALLVEAGIAEHRIKTVSLGEEGVLCVDGSDLCRRMNRRAHLEIRRIGQEHMTAPVIQTTTTEPADAPTDASSTPQGQDGSSVIPTPASMDSTVPEVSAGS